MNKIQEFNIIVIMSLPTTDTLDAWQETILSSVAEFSYPSIIVSLYDEDKLKYAINILKKHQKYLGFFQCTASTYHAMNDEISVLHKKIDAFPTNIITLFNPCLGDRIQLSQKIQLQLSKLRYHQHKLVELSAHNIFSSAMMLSCIAEKFHHPELYYHHLMNDPAEVRLETMLHNSSELHIITHFIHDFEDDSFIYVNPFIVYQFQNQLQELQKSIEFESTRNINMIQHDKKYDFVFGLTAFDDTRKAIIKEIKLSKLSKSSKFYYYYVDDFGKKIDTRVSYAEYLAQVKQSLTTLIIPAYVDTTFSVHRFIESIAQGCLPIIYKANYQIAFNQHSELLDIIEKYLLIKNIEHLQEKIDYLQSNHQQILQKLLNTPYIKNLSTSTEYQSCIVTMMQN